jgi:hypothetical protein
MKHTLDEDKRLAQALESAEMLLFFISVWDKRADRRGDCYCYESGYRLFKEKFRDNMACYHHILSKELYPQYAYCEENIVILSPEMHYRVEYNLEDAPQVMKLTQDIKKEHQNGKLGSALSTEKLGSGMENHRGSAGLSTGQASGDS